MGLGLTGALLILAFLLATFKTRSGLGKSLPDYGTVNDFTLTNQAGSEVSLTNLYGRVWVADIIFTRCPGPCLKMTKQMSQLQSALPSSSKTRLVTLTTDPDFDTPQVLKSYGQRFGANFDRWEFLTGAPKQIAGLATDSLKLTALAKKPEERESAADLFIHSTIFVIVDQHGHLRGIFETTGEGVDPAAVRLELLAAVKRLEQET
jgi:protein SCO1